MGDLPESFYEAKMGYETALKIVIHTWNIIADNTPITAIIIITNAWEIAT